MNSRCDWASGSEAMARYHDEEWGRPHRGDPYLFELLLLESMQAGLSWAVVLAKRAEYRRLLYGPDPDTVAALSDAELDALLLEPGIIRHRLKVKSLRTNATAFLAVQREFGSFSTYLWAFVDGQPIVSAPRRGDMVPAQTELSGAISKDLKRRGFTFLGSTTVQAYLQAVGVVDDHVIDCSDMTWNR